MMQFLLAAKRGPSFALGWIIGGDSYCSAAQFPFTCELNGRMQGCHRLDNVAKKESEP